MACKVWQNLGEVVFVAKTNLRASNAVGPKFSYFYCCFGAKFESIVKLVSLLVFSFLFFVSTLSCWSTYYPTDEKFVRKTLSKRMNFGIWFRIEVWGRRFKSNTPSAYLFTMNLNIFVSTAPKKHILTKIVHTMVFLPRHKNPLSLSIFMKGP